MLQIIVPHPPKKACFCCFLANTIDIHSSGGKVGKAIETCAGDTWFEFQVRVTFMIPVEKPKLSAINIWTKITKFSTINA